MNESSNREFRKIKSLNFLYEINSNGTIIRNIKSKKQLKIKLDKHHSKAGYYVTFVHMSSRQKDAKNIRVMIHRIVAECWLGECPTGFEVDHIDRNTHNNDYRNLRYVNKTEQMKNRDHSQIPAKGKQPLKETREYRMKPVRIYNDKEDYTFESYAACARFLESYYNEPCEHFRDRLKRHRSHIRDFDIIFLNAETIHGRSTEQEIVHKSDLSGDYKASFNKGKQQEVEMRVKHSKTEEV